MLTYDRPAPRKRVVALGYDKAKDEAPKVVATGQGALADQILKLARENGVPIKEDPVLATALATLDLEQTIPPELYAVVAEVLIYVWRVRERKANTR
ncbi:MAG: EscU/YscU/HrcU family type III secretion system export apparatus switch protein [Anaerolineales bacterium]|nr:EscU/YscU/HrcU family type III secretion system export apparatus switch protein [Anaerolineales bacterium]